MSPRPRAGCPGSLLRAFAASLVLAAGSLVAPADAVAQPPKRRPPPVVRDTLAQPDTAAAGLAADSAAPAARDTTPPAQLPRLPETPGQGWHAGVWTWDRTDLLLSGALTLTDLLERVPGVAAVRYGFVGLPETASGLGGTAGRLELLLDGFALDPLAGSGLDLSRIELAELESVRVERRLGSLRVEVESMSSREPTPYSRIEAGTGDFRTNLLRGLFLAPRVLGGAVGLGVERLASEGIGFNEPTENFSGWAKWTLAGETRGLQLEYRRSSTSRQADSLGRFEGKRDDLVLRARVEPVPGLTAAAFVGRSAVDDALDGPADTLRVREAGTQAGILAGFRRDGVRAAASLRARTNRGLPGWDAELTAGGTAGRILSLDGTVRLVDWREGQRALSASIRAQAGPLLGIRPVAEWYTGRSGAPFLTDTAGVPILTERTGARVGAELVHGRFAVGAAGLVLETDSVPDLGLAFSRSQRRLFPGGRVKGWEVTARIPSPWRPLSLEGWYTRWLSGRAWIYLPQESGRVGLVFHDTPLASGNLELLARLEARHRGAMLVPGLHAVDEATGQTISTLVVAPAATTLDFYFQLRIKSVRAFLRWENLANRRGLWDVAGRELPGQRIFYGVKWQFRN